MIKPLGLCPWQRKNWEVDAPYCRKDSAHSRYFEEWGGPGHDAQTEEALVLQTTG